MDRLSIERRLLAYVDALDDAKLLPEGRGRQYYRTRFDIARNLLARWQGGESEERLKAAVFYELLSYCWDQADQQPDAAESVGIAFGGVLRAVGIGPETPWLANRSPASTT